MPLDKELFESASQSNFLPEVKQRGGIDVGLFSEAYEALSKKVSRPPRELTGAQQEEKEIYEKEQAQLAHARGILESSPLPGVRALTTQVGAGLVSMGARISGQDKYADAMQRFSGAIEQAARERDERSILPEIVSRGVRGAGVSMGTMVPAGMLGGPYGAITAAAMQETNSAITEGRDAGKKGRDLAGYAITQGVVEAVPAAVMQKVGLGGIESIFGKKSVSLGLKEGFKRMGVMAGQELIEEVPTELTHAIVSSVLDVNPEATSPERLKQTVADTTVQTIITSIFMGSPNVARSWKAGKVHELTKEIVASAEGDRPPSTRDWKRWGLSPEFGKSRRQRRLFVQEVAKKVEAEAQTPAVEQEAEPPARVEEMPAEAPPVAPEGPEVAMGPPVAAVEPAMAPEVSEVAPGPEAVTEAPGAVIEKKDLPDWSTELEDYSSFEDAREDVFGSESQLIPKASESDEYLYHATFTENLPGIFDSGLIPGGSQSETHWGGGFGKESLENVYLDDDPSIRSGAAYYAEIIWRNRLQSEGTASDPVFLRVEKSNLPGAKRTSESDTEFAHSGSIDRSLLELWMPGQGKWVRLAPKVTPELGIAPEPEAAEVPATPASLEATALNKETTDRIRAVADLSALPEEAVQTFDSVLGRVVEEGHDEKALSIASEVLETGRQIDSHEHVAMVVKADKLLTELEGVQERQAKAAGTWNEAAYKQAMANELDIVDQLDELTRATRYSRREIARALSIGRLRLSRENFDVASILERMQVTKGPGKKLTKKDRKLALDLSKKHAEKVKELEQVEEELKNAKEERDAVLAGKVLAVNKPKKAIGRGIVERARKEREDIKNQIRGMGYRVNDITGVSAEGLYLVGRLGITYIKEGAGTLVEVAENLRRDMPELELSQHDVNQALIARSPKEKVRERSEGTKRVAKLKSMAKMEVAIVEMAEGIYEKTQRNVVPMDKELKALKKKFTKLSNEYFASERYDSKVLRARETVNRLLDQLENGRKQIKAEPKEVPPELAGLYDQAKQLRMEIRTDEKLASIKEQLRTGEYVIPVKKEKKPVNRRLQRKQTELMRARREIIQAISDTAPWTAGKVAKEIAFNLKAVAATADLSFTMRQNLWMVFSHPVLAKKAFIPSIKALFSEYKADEINNAILNLPNAFLYEQAGVVILDANSPDVQQRTEVFRGRVIEKIPVIGHIMRASSRHAAVISNLMRTSAFDQFIAYNPNATNEEMQLMADYINVSTGLGNLGKAGAIGEALQLGFFSPKFSVSRVELPVRVIQALMGGGRYKGMSNVRKQMAGDLVSVVGTGMLVLMLANLAGFDVDFLDPEDPDWGKIRIGNMRIDIWGGFQQPARVVMRILLGTLGDEDVDPWEILSRFAAFKFSPAFTVPIEVYRGKTAVGEEVTLTETAATAAMPLVARDVIEAWEEHGAKGAMAAGALGAVGIGVSTYKDSESGTRREIKKLVAGGEWGKAESLYWGWNNENPDDQISREWFLRGGKKK